MWWFFLSSAYSEIPPPSYREALVDRAYREVDQRLEEACPLLNDGVSRACEPAMLKEAISLANRFQEQLFPDPDLEYLLGLASRYQGRDEEALSHYRKAISLDKTCYSCWYDLGELYLIQGDLDQAESAFKEVTRLVPAGPKAWVGPWRLAEVAATRRDPVLFEVHIREALSLGFSFRYIQGTPNWKRFYADPVMRDSVKKLIVVYGSSEVLPSLEGE